jgi:hypothetical protein
VFGTQEWSVQHFEGLLDVLRLCNIRLIGRFRKTPNKLLEEGLEEWIRPSSSAAPTDLLSKICRFLPHSRCYFPASPQHLGPALEAQGC